jgi:hypothetical protein
MNIDRLEEVFRKTGRKPVGREPFGKFDLFFADGFSQAPHTFFQNAGGIQPGEFPAGMFVTTWLICKDRDVYVGRDLFFDLTQLSLESRISAARKDAKNFYKSLKKKRLH